MLLLNFFLFIILSILSYIDTPRVKRNLIRVRERRGGAYFLKIAIYKGGHRFFIVGAITFSHITKK